MIWLTGGALAIALVMIVGLLAFVVWQGLGTFWPGTVVGIETRDKQVLLGEISRRETAPATKTAPSGAATPVSSKVWERLLIRTGNFELTGTHFTWVNETDILSESEPEWAVVVERLEWGRFYGTPEAFLLDGKRVATGPDAAWKKYLECDAPTRRRTRERVALEGQVRELSPRLLTAQQNLRYAEIKHGRESAEYQSQAKNVAEIETSQAVTIAEIERQIQELNVESARYRILFKAADGREKELPIDEIVRAYPANQLDWWGRLRCFLDRWREFLLDAPRGSNSEGGVFPAIFGTVVMTLFMSLAVTPFGVLAAMYLREYAKAGTIISAVRIAINNLAGVPSIVFGVFGLGFFCYAIGGSIDTWFFPAALANNHATFGTGGVLWASLTLALLTLPVVIVTTEEALAAVPSSMREGSYACGASKWQTIKRIVLPRAAPGIMTGMILAMARGAGEVAPLMLVGAAKSAPELPIDGMFPFIHPQRSFMHLGFMIYDLGFQSPNSEAAKPMVYTTTLLLIGIVTFLNVTAIWLRNRLRRRYETSHF
jgi:phosphate transport system permease protein